MTQPAPWPPQPGQPWPGPNPPDRHTWPEAHPGTRYRLEERQRLTINAYRTVWCDTFYSREAALTAHAVVVAFANAVREPIYRPGGTCQLVVKEVTR